MEETKTCSIPDCKAPATDFCIFCKKDYCENHIFVHECEQSEDDQKPKETRSANNEKEEEEEEHFENRCSGQDCKKEGTDFCFICKKYYCENHYYDHKCERPDLQKSNKESNGEIDTENAEEINDNKCDYLCCTLEAPFACPICHQRLCEMHVFNHECEKVGRPAASRSEIEIKNTQTEIEIKPENSNTIFTKENLVVIEEEKKEEKFVKKCDFYGCTSEAPFLCPICQFHYCASHALRHECKQ